MMEEFPVSMHMKNRSRQVQEASWCLGWRCATFAGGLDATVDLSYTKLIVGDHYINITSTKIVAESLEGIIMKNADLYDHGKWIWI